MCLLTTFFIFQGILLLVSPCLMGLAERSRRRREPRPMKTLSGRMVSLLLARDSVISFRVAASIVESMCWM